MTELTAHHGLLKDIELHVDDYGGGGRPVVLIHGWPLSGEAFEAQLQPLQAAGYRVVTYDRRGFGRSDKPVRTGYTYDTLTEDLHAVLTELELDDVTLVGFSMGGGEVVRYATNFGNERVRSVVLASAVPPFLMKTDDNPEGPLEKSQAAKMTAQLTADEDAFYDQFATDFFSVGDELKVSEAERQEALTLCHQASKPAALDCMAAFATTDFRDDLLNIAAVPTLILHGDGDKIVPFEGSGARTHKAIPGSTLHVLTNAPHGCNVSHSEEWNNTLIDFLAKNSTATNQISRLAS